MANCESDVNVPTLLKRPYSHSSWQFARHLPGGRHRSDQRYWSAKRQYALRGRAVALGWSDEQVVVIDNDQGESGASAAWREGFQRLVSDVGMGRAGIVMGIPRGRLGTADEIAELVRFLAGPESSYCNGDVFAASGGFV